MIFRTAIYLLAYAAILPAAQEYSWWIDECTPYTAKATGCMASDPELGKWALEAWQRESDGMIVLKKSPTEEHAQLRLHWVSGTSGLYGETKGLAVDGKPGANIYVLPSVAPTADALMRETIVYLTCLHESGHAFGLPHTREFADIMYSFQYGGDIAAYFGRYREQLKKRGDIAAHSGISDADRVAFHLALRR